MKAKVEAKKEALEEGKHEGVIVGTEERLTTQGYKYLDVDISVGDKSIKAGYAAYVSPESKLGLLLARFGADISTPGTMIDTDQILMNKACTFVCSQTEKDGKTYANVVPESLKPVEVEKV